MAPDERVVTLGLERRRVPLTEDKDFGQLVLASGKREIGVILTIRTAEPPGIRLDAAPWPDPRPRASAGAFKKRGPLLERSEGG